MPADAFGRVVAAGGVVLFGADTVYGLCCDAGDAGAVARLHALKGRSPRKPSAILFFSLEAAFAALLPGPLTLLVPNPAGRFPLAGGSLLGVRVIDVGLTADRALLQSSANLAGGADARTLAEVAARIRAGVDLELDRGELPGVPSTVVDLGSLELDGSWQIVRAGACTSAAIERALVGSEL